MSWNAPNVTNGILLKYTLIYSNTTNTFVAVYNNETFEDTISYLNKYTIYSFAIYANTSAGPGSNATNTIRTLEDGKYTYCIQNCYNLCVQGVKYCR